MDHSLAATYYRTGLLLGLVRGEIVHRWAEQVIEREDVPPQAFIDVVSASPADLTALRHALWPIVREPEPPEVLHALLAVVYADVTSGRRGLMGTLSVLEQMRRMVHLPPAMYAELNTVLLSVDAQSETGQAVLTWLQRFERSTLAL